MFDIIPLLILVTPVAALVWYAVRHNRRSRRAEAILEDVRRARPLFYTSSWSLARYAVDRIGRPPREEGRRCAVLAVTEKRVAIHAVEGTDETFAFAPGELRWFGRTHNYRAGRNEMWLHVQVGAAWYLLRVILWRSRMVAFVRAMKRIATEKQVTAYRRRRPYIHYGPVPARPATQDIYGAWTLAEPLDLYLMPLYLVLLRRGEVERTIELATIQQIGAFKRLDAPEADGLVRFSVADETFAFALPAYEAVADALAEAAKRTLETPIIRKGKDEED